MLHDTLLGVKRAASAGVFVKMRNPSRTSEDRRESSSDRSVSGSFGKSHAVTIVVCDGIRGPLNGTPDLVVGRGVREHPAQHAIAATRPIAAAGNWDALIFASVKLISFRSDLSAASAQPSDRPPT